MTGAPARAGFDTPGFLRLPSCRAWIEGERRIVDRVHGCAAARRRAPHAKPLWCV